MGGANNVLATRGQEGFGGEVISRPEAVAGVEARARSECLVEAVVRRIAGSADRVRWLRVQGRRLASVSALEPGARAEAGPAHARSERHGRRSRSAAARSVESGG